MTLVEMLMPKMGESIMEGTILTWLKKVGDPIDQDESVLEVATDKVDTEVPSIYTGTLKEILANEGEVIQVGKPIAVIAVDGEVIIETKQPQVDTNKKNELVGQSESAKTLEENISNVVMERSDLVSSISKLEKSALGKFYSPLILNIAKEESITIDELDALSGTGKEGRVTKRDVLTLVRERKLQSKGKDSFGRTPILKESTTAELEEEKLDFDGNDEIVEMDRMRKMIAKRMLSSVQTAPHVTSFVEADVSGVVTWRNAKKRAFMESDGQALTFTPIFIEAVVKAIKDYPMINIQVDGDNIIKKGRINIGMAVALPSGNLIVPVIHDAHKLDLRGITLKVNDLARRARNNKLTADDLADGTYTVSNVGSFGNVMGTPIIVQPQVGILALGVIAKKPSVVDTPNGDAIAIRHKMFMSHSYDHRVVDGALGGMFVRRVADYLEKFDTTRSL